MNKRPRTLDWQSNHDERSRNYPVSEIIENQGDKKEVLWEEGIVLDQGREGACVGSEWMGKDAPLQLDHINGKRTDNRIENLRILCSNCHAQTETWTGKNRPKYPNR